MAAQLNTSLMTVAIISLLVPAAFVSKLPLHDINSHNIACSMNSSEIVYKVTKELCC